MSAETAQSASGEAVHTTHPMIGIVAVLLGAMIATAQGRLLSVGLPDLRGAIGLGADEASWLGTAYNAATMFIGPFSVYLGGLLGPRRVLMACGFAYTLIAFLLPLSGGLPLMLALLALAGLTAGTFYPLTLSFILRNLPMRYVVVGIAVYGLDIVFTTHVAHSTEALLVDHLSWRWIFWMGAVATPVMLLCVHFGIAPQPLPQPKPGQPRPSWRGFLYFSLGAALIYAALDQGQRLDWWNSRTFIAFIASGAFLCLASLTRRLLQPNPLVNLSFLARRNVISLAILLAAFRFLLLSTVVLLPSFLASVRGYRPEETGPVLLWIALPQVLAGILAIWLLGRIDSRLVLAIGFTLIAVGCLLNAQLDSQWAGSSFWPSQLVLALGQGLALNGLVGSLILEVVNSGAVQQPINALTFSGFFQTIRLMGGEIGVAFMQHWISMREQTHSNLLGLHVQLADPATQHRLRMLQGGMAPHSTGTSEAAARAGALLSLQVRQQAFTLSIADCFLTLAWASVASLCVLACVGVMKIGFREAKAANPS